MPERKRNLSSHGGIDRCRAIQAQALRCLEDAGFGQAGRGHTPVDLLGEAMLAVLEGAANNGSGRWNQNVNLVTCLAGVLRSISSHWKRISTSKRLTSNQKFLSAWKKAMQLLHSTIRFPMPRPKNAMWLRASSGMLS